LTHEHFFLDFHQFYREPPKVLTKYFDDGISLKNAGFVKQYPYSSQYNIGFNDTDTEKAVLEDLKLFREFGGQTIVENTTHGLKRNLKFLYEVAKEAGVNVVAGTGHYVNSVQETQDLSLSVEQMVELYTNEIVDGVDVKLDSGETVNVKCGVIGEVASLYPIHDFEKRAIIATAEVQSALKCGVSFHPHRFPEAPFEIMRIYLEAGGAADKAVMSHLDRTIFDEDKLLEFSDLGSYCQYDLFGTECSHYQLADFDMPSDAQRIQKIKKLLDHGKAERVLISHDIHTKHRLVSFF
jgi:phosphotriesterase-related protein